MNTKTVTQDRYSKEITDDLVIGTGRTLDVSGGTFIGPSSGTFSKIVSVTGTESVTNSSTYADSTDLQITLQVGTYFFESSTCVKSSAFATAGAKERIVFTGSGTFSGILKTSSGATANAISSITVHRGDPVDTAFFDASGSIAVMRSGMLTVTSSGDLKIQFAQNSAVAAQTAILQTGSFLMVLQTE